MPPPTRSKRAPSRWWYVLPLPFVLAAGAAVTITTAYGFFGAVSDAPRLVPPEERALDLGMGTYLIYGEPLDSMSPRDTVCQVTAPGGQPVPLTERTDATYQVGGRYSGRSLYSFWSPSAGRYHVACQMTATRTGRVSVVESTFGYYILGVIGFLVILFGAVLFSIVVFLKRRKVGAPFP